MGGSTLQKVKRAEQACKYIGTDDEFHSNPGATTKLAARKIGKPPSRHPPISGFRATLLVYGVER